MTSSPKRQKSQPIDPALVPFLDELARIVAAAEARDAEALRAVRAAARRLNKAAQRQVDDGSE